jgi:hypothetical protein
LVLCVIATHVWFIRFSHTTKDLGDPGSSRGTLERVRVDLTLYNNGVPLLYQTLTDIVGYGNGIKSGPVVVMDAKTIKIPAFSYDGKGEEVYFFAGEGPQPSSKVPAVLRPRCLSRIPDPDFYPFRILDPKTATKERGEKKLVVKPFFVATNFTKL